MQPDDHICLCHKVSMRKLCAYLAREQPQKASQLSECLDAGTGCGWCIPYLESLHQQHCDGCAPELDIDPESYTSGRDDYRAKRRAEKRKAAGLDPPSPEHA